MQQYANTLTRPYMKVTLHFVESESKYLMFNIYDAIEIEKRIMSSYHYRQKISNRVYTFTKFFRSC